MTGFNVNCRDCIHIAWNKEVGYYCTHPRMFLAAGGMFWPIEDINQNVDCTFFENFNPTNDD